MGKAGRSCNASSDAGSCCRLWRSFNLAWWRWRRAAEPTIGPAITKRGHEVRLMSPRFVRPYVKSNKNDAREAEAICEAVGRPSMRFVAVKSQAQQDMLALHRVRSLLVRER